MHSFMSIMKAKREEQSNKVKTDQGDVF